MASSVFQDLLNSLTRKETRTRRVQKRRQRVSTPEQLQTECEHLLKSDGEASSINLARSVFAMYAALLDTDKQLDFFRRLRNEFGPDPGEVEWAYEAYQKDTTGDAARILFEACEPPRQELLRRLNLAPSGTRELVGMRASLLSFLRDNPELKTVDYDFHHLFNSWFNQGFLVLRRIDWSSPASVLEKLIEHEAVHEIHDWDDLQRRLDPHDRRCFAFFHPALGDEPIIFVEVALTDKLPNTSQDVAHADYGEYPFDTANTAAFFGISNCQPGLKGISFGSSLLKQVVQELKDELPNLDTFVTLSPVPGFCQWALDFQRGGVEGPEIRDEELAKLDLLTMPSWHTSASHYDMEELRGILLPLAAWYLVEAKNKRGFPVNSVARFHLRNGARIEHINWLGDISQKNLFSGAGLMVNYIYDLDQIETNHERLMNQGVVAASREVQRLIQQSKDRKERVRA